MKKNNYSLTAKERKQLNKANAGQVKQVEEVAIVDELPKQEASKVAHNRKSLTIFVAVGMLVLFLTFIVVAMLLYEEMQTPYGNPTATISLSNGMKLDFEIYEDTATVAATNFMFLSMKGFFDDTVIHDNQNQWLRFMGMTDYDTYRGSDEDYCKSFTGFDKRDYEWGQAQTPTKRNIFSYRLHKGTSPIDFTKEIKTEGLLAYMYNYSSTLFQISCVDGPSTRINGNIRNNFVIFAKYLNEKTLENIRALNLGEFFEEGTTKNGSWYNPNTVIKINSITIKNYDKSKWTGKNGILNNFDTYMDSINGYNAHTSSYITSI